MTRLGLAALALTLLPLAVSAQTNAVGDWKAVFVGPVGPRPKPYSEVRFTVRETPTGLAVEARAGNWPGVLEVSDVKLEGSRLTFTGTGKLGWRMNDVPYCCPKLMFDGTIEGDTMKVALINGSTYGQTGHPIPMEATRLSNEPGAARLSREQLHQGADAPCNVTLPNGVVAGAPLIRPAFSYGNRLVSIGVPNAVVFHPGGAGFLTRDGSLVWKFLWGRGGPGKFKVTGRRLDEDAPPLRTRIGDGFEDKDFQPSYLIFPTPGCWEVTAQIGDIVDSRLTFVTRVVKIGDGPKGRWDPPTN